MKKWILTLMTVCLILIWVIISTSLKKESPVQQISHPPQGVAIIITGAAARIPQEAALLEELYNRGLLKNVVFISGVSSGALNAVMLNGILSGRITWKEYKDILCNIKNEDIFIQEGNKLPVNTEPARNLYKKIFEERLGYYQIGDLPYTTAISVVNIGNILLKRDVLRLYSRKINQLTDTTLSIVDITMASSAVPLVFPAVRIRNVKTIPDVKYIDGSVGDDHVPYKALLEFQKYRNRNIEKVFIISRKSDSIPNLGDELRNLGFDNIKTPDRFGLTVENILKRDIIRKLMDFEQEAPELRGRIYVWIPDFEKDFLLFNFDNLKEQYDLTLHWSKTHNPVALEEFLNPYRKNEKSLDSLLLRPLSRLKLKIRNP